MVIARGSTEQNTWTIEESLLKQIASQKNSQLRVTNKRGRSHTYSRKEVLQLWINHNFVTSRSGYLVKVIRFPWHPLNW